MHLALALSLDGGDTWPHVRDLEPGGANDAVPRGDEGVLPAKLGAFEVGGGVQPAGDAAGREGCAEGGREKGTQLLNRRS